MKHNFLTYNQGKRRRFVYMLNLPYALDAVLKENFLKFVNPDVHVTNLNFILTNLIVIVRIWFSF